MGHGSRDRKSARCSGKLTCSRGFRQHSWAWTVRPKSRHIYVSRETRNDLKEAAARRYIYRARGCPRNSRLGRCRKTNPHSYPQKYPLRYPRPSWAWRMAIECSQDASAAQLRGDLEWRLQRPPPILALQHLVWKPHLPASQQVRCHRTSPGHRETMATVSTTQPRHLSPETARRPQVRGTGRKQPWHGQAPSLFV